MAESSERTYSETQVKEGTILRRALSKRSSSAGAHDSGVIKKGERSCHRRETKLRTSTCLADSDETCAVTVAETSERARSTSDDDLSRPSMSFSEREKWMRAESEALQGSHINRDTSTEQRDFEDGELGPERDIIDAPSIETVSTGKTTSYVGSRD